MNIIGNSCASSYVVRDLLKEQFSNPFVWCSITEADILYVMNNYNNIVWNNFKTELYENKTLHTKNVKIIVDNKFEIKYPHYCLSKDNTKVNGINVFSKDIIQWANNNKYTERTARMTLAGPPFYIIGGTWEDQMMSKSTRYTYNKCSNVYILNSNGIYHDNYKVAVANFASIQAMLINYTKDKSLPSLKSTESLV